MTFPCLFSSRLSLREHFAKDANDYYYLLSNAEAIKYYGRNPIYNFLEAKVEIETLHTKYIESKLIKWAITINTNEIYIGSVGIKDYVNVHHRGTLSCIILPKYWHYGYASEALNIVIEFAFKTLNLNRLQVYVDPVNIRAITLFKNLGFNMEAILREYEFERDMFIDIAIFGLTKKDR